jgi:shikimate kinase
LSLGETGQHPRMPPFQIVLVGYRGCGKSTIARALAAEIGLEAVDLDQAVELQSGRSIAEIFASDGEAGFRDIESRILAEVLSQTGYVVIATGGGIVERPENRRLLRLQARSVVYLAVPSAVLAARLSADAGGRPSLTGAGVAAEVSAVLERRDPWYREVADHVLDASRAPDSVVADLVAIVENERRKSV